MTQTNQLIDNQFTTLTDEELTHVNGGVAPFIIYGGCIITGLALGFIYTPLFSPSLSD